MRLFRKKLAKSKISRKFSKTIFRFIYMNTLVTKLRQIWKTKDLRKKIVFTVVALLIFRLAAQTTIPFVDLASLKTLLDQQQGNAALSVFALLTGGAMTQFSVVLMGLTPYINASIIMQLLGVMIPALEDLKKEGEQGQKKISQYTRLLTVPLAFVQSYGMIALLNSFGLSVIDVADWSVMLPTMITVTAGSIFMMWLGELITEKGLGNGISILIFAGIVATVPSQLAGALQAADWVVVAGIILAMVVMTAFIVYVSEADRRVPVVYTSKRSNKTMQSFLPLKINQAGMIPIIFAVSIISMPSIMSRFLLQAANPTLQSIGQFFNMHLNPGNPSMWYNLGYALLIFGFTFFYISITFEPKKVAENIQSRGGFIPGYRPGQETIKFLGDTVGRLAFWGALFLTAVAIIPVFFEKMISSSGNITLFISGASMIIIVSVVLDIIRKINAQLVMQDYDKL